MIYLILYFPDFGEYDGGFSMCSHYYFYISLLFKFRFKLGALKKKVISFLVKGSGHFLTSQSESCSFADNYFLSWKPFNIFFLSFNISQEHIYGCFSSGSIFSTPFQSEGLCLLILLEMFSYHYFYYFFFSSLSHCSLLELQLDGCKTFWDFT